MHFQTARGAIPFMIHTAHRLRFDKTCAKELLHIDHVARRVDPGDPNNYLSQPAGSENFGRERFAYVFVHVFPRDKASLNTAAIRRHWAEIFAKFFNCPSDLDLYDSPCEASFFGDETPFEDSEVPPLTHFLTTRDTISVATKALHEQSPYQQVSSLDQVLKQYFEEEMFSDVLREMSDESDRFTNFGNVSPERNATVDYVSSYCSKGKRQKGELYLSYQSGSHPMRLT